MSEPTIKKPTKKTFHFPKGEAGKTAAEPVAEKAVKPGRADAKRAKAPAEPVEAVKSVEPVEVKEAAVEAKGKPRRAKKEKVVRDSFTMPKSEYDKIAVLKQKCLEEGLAVKKSELLRAGLQLLEASSTKRLIAALSALEAVKTGRPARS